MNDSKGSFAWSGDYDVDVKELEKYAQKPTTARAYYSHAVYIQTIFHRLIQGTDRAKNFPARIGLLRKIHDELFPIAYFCKLHFESSEDVSIRYRIGNQQHDAIVVDQRQGSSGENIEYLEVTTLQDRSDAELLGKLAGGRTTVVEGNLDQNNFTRKLFLLKTALDNKASILYPKGTALLVYMDEDRFQRHTFGFSPPKLDWKKSVAEIVEEAMPKLTSFSGIFVYRRDGIIYPAS